MAVARRLGGVHLVSADSMQVYRRMDIGTAKPTPAEQAEVPHHCIDLVEPTVDFTVAAVQGGPRATPSPTSKRSEASRCSSAAPVCTTGS